MAAGDISFRVLGVCEEQALVVLWGEAGLLRSWNDPMRDIAFASRDAHSTILVGVEDGRMVASVMVGEDGHRGWMYYVAVAADRRGRGLGRAAVAAAESWLARRGVWKAQLLVRGDNGGAIGFYRALGYRDTGTTCLQRVIEPGPASHVVGGAA